VPIQQNNGECSYTYDIIASYRSGKQYLFVIDENEELSELELLRKCFVTVQQDTNVQNLEVLSVCKFHSGNSEIKKYLFNPDVNTDEETARTYKILQNYIKNPSTDSVAVQHRHV